MPSQTSILKFHKQVPVWSGRKRKKILVDVDYHRIREGDFTLIHLDRLRDTAGNDTAESTVQSIIDRLLALQ